MADETSRIEVGVTDKGAVTIIARGDAHTVKHGGRTLVLDVTEKKARTAANKALGIEEKAEKK